ncbi:hypothetical protein DL96DRAFT_1687065 [Flagelloscypha sp. PMI_526]|nr:hypothetical protein DL96DRAFT_1687065 [Flagelloscypha sp. PMI_526]
MYSSQGGSPPQSITQKEPFKRLLCASAGHWSTGAAFSFQSCGLGTGRGLTRDEMLLNAAEIDSSSFLPPWASRLWVMKFAQLSRCMRQRASAMFCPKSTNTVSMSIHICLAPSWATRRTSSRFTEEKFSPFMARYGLVGGGNALSHLWEH